MSICMNRIFRTPYVWAIRDAYARARNDFFHLSRCKDLLFNVKEHHFTIDELSESFEALKLEFRGFQLPEFVPDQPWRRFPHGKAARQLGVWAKFEEKNPDAFEASDGYLFWCRKPE